MCTMYHAIKCGRGNKLYNQDRARGALVDPVPVGDLTRVISYISERSAVAICLRSRRYEVIGSTFASSHKVLPKLFNVEMQRSWNCSDASH